VAKFIKKHAIEVVHVHWKNDLAIATLAKKFSSNCFRLVHSRHMNLPGKKHDLYHKFIYNSLDYFIATTKSIERQAEINLPLNSKNIRQIYLGVKPPHLLSQEDKVSLREKFKLNDTFSIGLFGRITELKGQHLLIEAIDQLKDEGLTLTALIVGHSMEDAYLRRLKRIVLEKKLQDEIIFVGFYPEPTALMQCLDLLVLTTRCETFGLVLVEGMHVGVPVIGSNAGGVPEIIDHGINGLLFESENVQVLADAIRRLYADPELRRQLVAAGKQKAELCFNAETQYKKVRTCLTINDCS
jgi:glycosyltransferase involved in cell wall biosynthesis